MQGPFLKGSYFIFYSLFLLVISLLLKQRRSYFSIPLILFLLWHFVSIFIHNEFKVVPNSIMNHYFNVAFMSEGFMYTFCGIGLFIAIVRYSTNLKFIYLFLPVFLIPMYKLYMYGGRITPLLAIGLSSVIYLVLKKRYLVASLVGTLGVIVLGLNMKWVLMKFLCRPMIWKELVGKILQHPWIGIGFNTKLSPDNMVWIPYPIAHPYGWVYAHNDLLNIGSYLGILAPLILIYFVVDLVKNTKQNYNLILVLSILFTSLFQMTFFEADKAAICIVLLAISVIQSREAV